MSQPSNPSLDLPPSFAAGPYRHEKTLFTLAAALSILFWAVLTLSTIGIVWLYMAFLYLFALLAQSALIAFLKGNAVRISATQFPDLNEAINACRRRLGITAQPEAYLMTGNGVLNAFATRFLRRYYVVLLSDVVDALAEDADAINFYIGHELGHVDRKHIANGWWLAPAMMLPLLGAGYRRAQEYTCDQYGAACCNSPASAMRAIAVLAAGSRRWQTLNPVAYIEQATQSGGFWMSLNELAGDYPWLCKRMARVVEPAVELPSRHPLAWVLALLIPRFGPGGPLLGLMMLFASIGIVAAIAIPAYQEYTQRAAAMPALDYGRLATRATADYYLANRRLPASVDNLGLEKPGPMIREVTIAQQGGTVTLHLASGHTIAYQPSLNAQNRIDWSCATSLPAKVLPQRANCESKASGQALESLLNNRN